jgi:uncharacterized membrane protein
MHLAVLERLVAYGALGWCLEVLFTGLASVLLRRDRAATGTTYLWMFPIYAAGGLLFELLAHRLAAWPLWSRLGAYLLALYAVEFSTGYLLERLLGRCPWHYGERGVSLRGLVRLDYAPLWLLICWLFELTQRRYG